MKFILSREKLSSAEAGVRTTAAEPKALPFLLSSAADLEKGEEITQLTLPVKLTVQQNELLEKTALMP